MNDLGDDHPAPGSGRAEERVDLTGLSRLSSTPPPPKGERGVRVIRAISILLLAIAAVGLPVYFLARSPKEPDRPRTQPPATSTSVSPRPSVTSGPGTYEVFGVTGNCLRIRAAPGLTQALVDCVGNGVRLESDGQTQDVDGLLWRHVTYRKATGWAADRYLKPV